MSQAAHRTPSARLKIEDHWEEVLGSQSRVQFTGHLKPPEDVLDQYAHADVTGAQALAFFTGWFDGARGNGRLRERMEAR